MKKIVLATTIILTAGMLQAFDFNSILKNQTNSSTKVSKTNSSDIKPGLSSSTVSSGLKEALKIGINYATAELGKDGGYLNNQGVKISLPDNLAKAESLIRKAGGDKVADNLIDSMNSAATQAAPKTAKIFLNSIDNMSIDDAKNILAGDEDAATNYFKTNTTNELQKMIKPIIEKTMSENNVATYYNTFNEYYKSDIKDLVNSSDTMKMAKNFGVDSYLPSNTDENLDDYVTQKAIDGLFKMIAEKEAEIRKDPVEQVSSLLKSVFGN